MNFGFCGPRKLLLLALLLWPAHALADAKETKEKIAALAPSGLVLVLDAEGKELVAQNADQPFVPAGTTASRPPSTSTAPGCCTCAAAAIPS